MEALDWYLLSLQDTGRQSPLGEIPCNHLGEGPYTPQEGRPQIPQEECPRTLQEERPRTPQEGILQIPQEKRPRTPQEGLPQIPQEERPRALQGGIKQLQEQSLQTVHGKSFQTIQGKSLQTLHEAYMRALWDVNPQALISREIFLGPVHLPAPFCTLAVAPVIDALIPESNGREPVPFKTFLANKTTECLMLESFFNAHIRNINPDTTVLSLSSMGLSNLEFRNFFGPTTNIKAVGLTMVHFMHEGHDFVCIFILVDHLFAQRESESQYPAVLGTRFYVEAQIIATRYKGGWKPRLPPPSNSASTDCLAVYTHGCCIYQDLSDSKEKKGFETRAGFGVHFPSLPQGWDFGGSLDPSEPQNNQRAELKAIFRALWHIRTRNIKCETVQIYTDSHYAVTGFNEQMPRWRINGFVSKKKKEVANTDMWKGLDRIISILRKEVTFCQIKRENNKVADRIAQEAAADGRLY